MKSIPFLRAHAAWLSKRMEATSRRRAWMLPLDSTVCLEPRRMLSTASTTVPAIQMLSATTTDSKSVTIKYDISQAPDPSASLQFGIYRSSDANFDSSDSVVGTFTPVSPGGSTSATLDQSGQVATTVGTHQLTIPLPQGLPPFPEKPYVLVVADPDLPSATTNPVQTASFRTYTIGIVTHGGIQDTSWKHGPPWELQMAYEMKQEGYDAVIPYNWVAQSNHPGSAIKQSPKLAQMILNAASAFPASAPVNLDFIGHSEGTVINTYAMVSLKNRMTPGLEAGYITDTLLDPHAANNNLPGQQMSIASGVLAPLAKAIITNYQANAGDPPVFVPAMVDQAQVFFEHTASKGSDLYNLWGQVPVKSNGPVVHYYNLTPSGATHSGKTGVQFWYRNFIVPTLGEQAPLVQTLQLNGQIDDVQVASSGSVRSGTLVTQASAARDDRMYGPAQVVQTSQPELSGTAAPGSVVKLSLGPVGKPSEHFVAGTTQADSTGHWSLTTTSLLQDGRYRVVVSAFSRALRTRPGLTVVSMEPLGRLVVDTTG
jgi:Bacterial Ig-like domain